MNIIETPIKDLLIIEPDIFKDHRGYFIESYNENKFFDLGITNHFVQDNESQSTFGVVRGLHYQIGEYAQAKLVRVVKGKVFDVAVDLRKNSQTFGKWYGIELSEEQKNMFFIPKGFAHGFSVLSETAVFSYKCDQFYNKESERGILFSDPKLKIDWKIPTNKAIISEKDKILPLFEYADYF
ncbi:MAG TPA: dTDP-4-dehydrorhamnose 3,5-epimerase [Bacteroidales bacterium]|jgi:dTDP-4-dehydrorhamnose 3,5-epimerase|nr:dTDP-4-dehydrorhamnose 3,5-epimerase [Bacteroidales bacterium]